MRILEPIIILLGVPIVIFLVQYLILFEVRKVLIQPGREVALSILTHLKRPTQAIVPLIGLEITTSALRLPQDVTSPLEHGLQIALIFSIAWLIVNLTYILDDLLVSRFPLNKADNLATRRVHTQVQVLRRVAVVVVTVLSVATALLSFPSVRTAGAALLASAGLAGVVLGLAAKPTITNLIAGIQIAVSQPIRIDDVVVVEGHWGRIEEIALTYVVVRIWDLRRLVLPISYFIVNPFENWTRERADILGWVHLEVDYSAPVAEIREELHKILNSSPDWDGKVWNLQVTQLGTETMTLRALMSSCDSSTSWNLCCEVREKLVQFLQVNKPSALPRLRTQVILQ
ncbi:MAG: mechanosensitive ion channel family protein [Actinobacteria bacterium]|nr:mechanosensitive ion channel family protein [Actinomycetota bacterium]MCL6105670.1 mechanosensitive ion channel family protein [Actinomycetota bacterium]